MKCNDCVHHKLKTENNSKKGCIIWSEFKLSIRRLPIGTGCPSCGDDTPVGPNEFMQEIRKTGPKLFMIEPALMGNIIKFGCVVTYKDQEQCMFFRNK